MANKRISELPDAGAITGAELVEIVQSGTNVKSTVSAIGAGGAGTVTSFSSGNLTGLFTTNVATPTTTPALSFGFENQNANTVLAGPTTAPAAAPTFRALVAADIPSLSATYWTLASGGTLTGANTITSNTASQLTFTGTWTATANDQYHISIAPALTARGTVSEQLTTLKFGGSLTAGANGQFLYALDLTTTYNQGAFSNITNGAIKCNGLIDIAAVNALKLTFASSGSGTAISFFENATDAATISATGSTAGDPNALYLRTNRAAGNIIFATAANVQAIMIDASQRVGIGVFSSLTAYLHLAAVTSSRASLRIVAGSGTTAPSSPNSGELWHQGTNNRLMFQKGASSQEIMCTVQVNAVSPTAPDRTIQLTIDGTTYYIHAKTTND